VIAGAREMLGDRESGEAPRFSGGAQGSFKGREGGRRCCHSNGNDRDTAAVPVRVTGANHLTHLPVGSEG
jgi:hypothetical protein